MNFKNFYKKIYSVRLSLSLIIFIMTTALLILSTNFWIDVDKTRKYSKAAINNSYLQEKVDRFYNLLSEEKIIFQYSLSMSSKFINISSKSRKEIKKLRENTNAAFEDFLIEINTSDLKKNNNQYIEELKILWDEYQKTKIDISKTILKVIPLRGRSAEKFQQKKDEMNNADILLQNWLEISDKICMQLIIISEKFNFRPDNLLRSIEDLQSFKSLLLRYNEYIYREQAILSGLIVTDMPISQQEYSLLTTYQNIKRETRLTLEKLLSRSLEYNKKKINTESDFYTNFTDANFFDNSFDKIKTGLIEDGISWEEYRVKIDKYLKIIKDNKLSNEAQIINISNAISSLSNSLYRKSTYNQIIASFILTITLLLAISSFLIITFTIVRPLENITKVMEKLSKGKKTDEVPEINRAGEIGIMASSVANFKKQADNYAKQLEITVNERTKELKEVNFLLTSSIDYASKIQKAFLPQKFQLKDFCNDYFIYHDQRDVVGGDFYSIFKQNNKMYLAVFDCAGHGVPGALLTMILGSFMKNIILEEVTSPGNLLTKLNNFFKEALSNTEGYEVSEDGLDALVLEINKVENTFRYASAGMPLIKINEAGHNIFKGDKNGIGYSSTELNFEFKNFDLYLNKNDLIYMASDGICDQIGGEKGIAFGNKRLINTLETQKNLSMSKQKDHFIKIFKNYIGKNKRRDDITIIGLRI